MLPLEWFDWIDESFSTVYRNRGALWCHKCLYILNSFLSFDAPTSIETLDNIRERSRLFPIPVLLALPLNIIQAYKRL